MNAKKANINVILCFLSLLFLLSPVPSDSAAFSKANQQGYLVATSIIVDEFVGTILGSTITVLVSSSSYTISCTSSICWSPAMITCPNYSEHVLYVDEFPSSKIITIYSCNTSAGSSCVYAVSDLVYENGFLVQNKGQFTPSSGCFQ